MKKFNEFTLQRQLLAVLGTLPIFGWLSASVLYPMATKARSVVHLEEREGYAISHIAPAITSEIAMQASSHSEALLRGREQLNGYDTMLDAIYVEGGNSRLKEVTTIEPVTVKKLNAEEAAMQNPLILLSERFNKDPHQSLYLIAYTLAPSYSRSYLGKPNNPYIQLREHDKQLAATRKFSGYPTPNKVHKEEAIFKKLLERDGYVYEDVQVAEYSPNWVFYFLRHNELIVPLKKATSL